MATSWCCWDQLWCAAIAGLDKDLDQTSKTVLEADVTTSKARVGQSLSMLVTAWSIFVSAGLNRPGNGIVASSWPSSHESCILDKRGDLVMWLSLFWQHCHSYWLHFSILNSRTALLYSSQLLHCPDIMKVNLKVKFMFCIFFIVTLWATSKAPPHIIMHNPVLCCMHKIDCATSA